MGDNLLAALLCFGAFLAVGLPTARVVEDFTNEKTMKWLWLVVLGFLALAVFIGLSGMGRMVNDYARIQREQGKAAQPAQSEEALP